MRSPAARDLALRVAASLAPHAADNLASVLAICARDPAAYEASVRGGAGCGPRAGRMMIEQASLDLLEVIARTLHIALPPAASCWIERAQHEGLPLIVGWDLRGGGNERCVKLYINASDASHAVRARLCAIAAPDVLLDEPPAVIGMNARSDGIVETKLYLQSAAAVVLAERTGPRARALAAAARDEGAEAGGVLAFDVLGSTLRARAFFVALREPPTGATWRCVRSLPGYDVAAIASVLPFAPAPPRSLGLSLGEESWTLYYKPRHSGRAPEALEPVAIFRVSNAEVGVFVEPTEHAARAFRRTERHAVSVRVRAGTPVPRTLESLIDWFTARLRTAERDGVSIATRLADPPEPWRHVDPTPPIAALEERP